MRYIDEAQHAIVSQAVAAAEEHTSGEIVTVLADRSDGYTDVALWWAMGFAFTAMSIFAAFPELFLALRNAIAGAWANEPEMGELFAILTGMGLFTFLAVLAVQTIQPLKFLLIPSPVKRVRVRDAAVKHFKVGAERRTHGRTGVLLYVSMREHRAEIVADEPIAVKVDSEVWGVAMADMLAEIKQGRIADGLAAGVRDVGAVLAEHFPRGEEDINELPDRLIEV